MADPDGGPAYPIVDSAEQGGIESRGMSLRDHFAVHAPEWWVRNKARQLRDLDDNRCDNDKSRESQSRDYVSFLCEAQYFYADMMLAQHAKGADDVR